MGMGEIMERGVTLIPLITPVDMQTGDNQSDWFTLRDFERALIVLYKGIGTAGQDPIFTLLQGTSSAGAGSKALKISKVRSKVGATLLSAIADFSVHTQAAADTYVDTVSAENEAMICVDVGAQDLDVQNGFSWLSLDIPDVGGNAQIGCALAFVYDGRFAQATPPSPIS